MLQPVDFISKKIDYSKLLTSLVDFLHNDWMYVCFSWVSKSKSNLEYSKSMIHTLWKLESCDNRFGWVIFLSCRLYSLQKVIRQYIWTLEEKKEEVLLYLSQMHRARTQDYRILMVYQKYIALTMMMQKPRTIETEIPYELEHTSDRLKQGLPL